MIKGTGTTIVVVLSVGPGSTFRKRQSSALAFVFSDVHMLVESRGRLLKCMVEAACGNHTLNLAIEAI